MSILIVGAGPTGLAAGLFLLERGFKARIIEKIVERSSFSKALGVNARTLELLESSGATNLFLKNGIKLSKLNLHKNNVKIGQLSIEQEGQKYSHILVQEQAESERILAELLERQGIYVERGVELVGLNDGDKDVEVKLKKENGDIETAVFNCVFAADGAHSTIRKIVGLSFNGTSYDEPWMLCDARITTNLSPNETNGFFFDNYFLLFIRIKNDVWRIVSNDANYLDKLPEGTKIHEIVWKSEFNISHRLIQRFNVGHVYFGGDAAHVHSPVGGRGMNLGIEDAYVFAKLFSDNKLDEYHDRRYKVVSELLQRINFASDIVRGKSFKSKFLRFVGPYVLPFMQDYVMSAFRSFTLGHDHEMF